MCGLWLHWSVFPGGGVKSMFWSELASLTGVFFFFLGGSGCRLCLLLRGGFGHVSNLAPALVLPRPLPCVLGWLWGLGSVFSSTLETSFVESLAPSPFRREVQDPSCWIPFSLPHLSLGAFLTLCRRPCDQLYSCHTLSVSLRRLRAYARIRERGQGAQGPVCVPHCVG